MGLAGNPMWQWSSNHDGPLFQPVACVDNSHNLNLIDSKVSNQSI